MPNTGDNWSEWQSAKELYDAGKLNEALQELRTHPNETAQYFYNLGTVHQKLGQSGQAVAYLSKAGRLQPHDPDIQHNLQIAQTTLGRVIGHDRLDTTSTSLEAFADRLALGEVRGAIGLLGLVVVALWLRSYLKTRDLKRTLLLPSGLLGLVGLTVALSLYAAERTADSHPPAYAVERLTVRSGPGDRFAQLGQLEAGIKVRRLGNSQQGWEQVRFTRDGIGWVPVSSLLLF